MRWPTRLRNELGLRMSRPRRATGPRTPLGKAVSSQNARRHGLTAEPPAGLVEAWYNIILDNDPCAPEAPHSDDAASNDPRRNAALRLAIAEACYHRALHALEAHPREPGSAQVRMAEFQVAMHAHLDELVASRPNGRPQLEELEYASSALRRFEGMANAVAHEHNLYKRYVGEARAQRRKALRAWCDVNRPPNPNSRNELRRKP